MRVGAPAGAPQWAHDLAEDAQNVIDNMSYPFVRRSPILVAELPPAADYVWKKFFVSNGTGGMTEVTSNGVGWFYPTGAPA